MKILDRIVKTLLVSLMLLSIVGILFYSDTMEQFTLYWLLLMLSGSGTLTYIKMDSYSNQNK
jgi:hypothetical protein